MTYIKEPSHNKRTGFKTSDLEFSTCEDYLMIHNGIVLIDIFKNTPPVLKWFLEFQEKEFVTIADHNFISDLNRTEISIIFNNAYELRLWSKNGGHINISLDEKFSLKSLKEIKESIDLLKTQSDIICIKQLIEKIFGGNQ